MAITYRQLAISLLNDLTSEQLDQTATIYIPGVDEYYPMYERFTITDEDCDVVDDGHIILTIDDCGMNEE